MVPVRRSFSRAKCRNASESDGAILSGAGDTVTVFIRLTFAGWAGLNGPQTGKTVDPIVRGRGFRFRVPRSRGFEVAIVAVFTRNDQE